MHIIIRLFCCTVFFLIHTAYLHAGEKREIVGNNLVIKDSIMTTVTVLTGPESMSDYWASFNIIEGYEHVFNENAANKDWVLTYDYDAMSTELGKIIRECVPQGNMPENTRVLINCIVALSGRIDMISYTIKSRSNGKYHLWHQDIPAEIYVKLDKAIKENIRFPSWKDKVPYKCPTIVCYPYSGKAENCRAGA